MDHTELEIQLGRDRAWLLEAYAQLPLDDLTRPATASESDPSATWSALDHLVHLAGIERAFNEMIERFIAGDDRPIAVTSKPDGSRRPMDEIMAAVHRGNEDWVQHHRAATLGDAVVLGQQIRAETLALLARLTEEQLLQKLPGAPWADGTIGGVLSTNALHGRMHWKWVRDGWAAQPSPHPKV